MLCWPITKPEAPHVALAHPALTMCSASSGAPEVPNLPVLVSKKGLASYLFSSNPAATKTWAVSVNL